MTKTLATAKFRHFILRTTTSYVPICHLHSMISAISSTAPSSAPIRRQTVTHVRSNAFSSRTSPLRPRHVVPFAKASDADLPPPGIETQGQNFPALKDIQQIMDILPHRYPFLLVDRVLEWEYGKYAVGYKCVTVNDNFFPGHFPQRAIMPGVLQVEAMAQLAGIVMLDPQAGSESEQNNNFFFGGVDGCKWRKPVVPGDVLMMRVDVTKFNPRFGICKVKARAFVGEDLVCEADLTLVLAK